MRRFSSDLCYQSFLAISALYFAVCTPVAVKSVKDVADLSRASILSGDALAAEKKRYGLAGREA